MDILCTVKGCGDLIPVTPAPKPSQFNTRVRCPGRSFLASTPMPRGRQWNGNDYWREILPDLWKAYEGTCAYCSSFVLRGDGSVDHFVPKSVAPQQAYEWNNFRLCRAKLNGYKGRHQDVLDPFILSNGWFEFNFLTFFLVPKSTLASKDRKKVVATIKRLKLNDDNNYVEERIGVISQYCLGKATLVQISKKFPFIAREMVRQEFDKNFLQTMSASFCQRQIKI